MDTLSDQLRRLADGEVSSVELTERALDRAHATRESLNAFRIVCADDARRAAAAADERRRSGQQAPLLGVPIAIKDDTDLAGYPTGFGCAGDFPVAVRDAEMVTRLRRAGAVVVGKTNTPELGQWPFTEGAAFGVTRNAWDPDRTPGGSSGGSATAVAAGIVAAAIGSDGAGSIRIPAAWSHLVGIKPQRGRISTWPWPEAFYGITVHGPLARTVADAARMLDVTAGSVDGDRHRPAPPVDTFLAAAGRTPPRLRVAVSTRVPFSGFPAHLDPRIETALRRVGEVLAGAGHRVADADPRYGAAGLSFLPRSHVGLYDWLERMPEPERLDRRTRENIRTGRWMRPLLGAARRFEKPLQRRIGTIFERYDVVLAPTTAQLPLRIGATDGLSNTRTDRVIVAACPYTWPWNVLGWPAVNVPAGLVDGLPVGVQLMGPAASEPMLISLAAELEALERWPDRVAPAAIGAAGVTDA